MNKKVVVKFETNGGNIIPSQQIEYGFLIVVPEPTRIGYEFSCWCLDESLKVEFDANKIIEDDLTLYAKWNNYAPKKFINDISVYTNLSNVVKDYQEIYNGDTKQSEEDQSKDKKEKARIDKSNYVKKLNDEYNSVKKEYVVAAIELNKAIQACSKVREKKDDKIFKKGEKKCAKIIAIYNEFYKKEEEAQTKYDSIIERLDAINVKYEEFVSKNK